VKRTIGYIFPITAYRQLRSAASRPSRGPVSGRIGAQETGLRGYLMIARADSISKAHASQ
jgi:hypothetical protein